MSPPTLDPPRFPPSLPWVHCHLNLRSLLLSPLLSFAPRAPFFRPELLTALRRIFLNWNPPHFCLPPSIAAPRFPANRLVQRRRFFFLPALPVPLLTLSPQPPTAPTGISSVSGSDSRAYLFPSSLPLSPTKFFSVAGKHWRPPHVFLKVLSPPLALAPFFLCFPPGAPLKGWTLKGSFGEFPAPSLFVPSSPNSGQTA